MNDLLHLHQKITEEVVVYKEAGLKKRAMLYEGICEMIEDDEDYEKIRKTTPDEKCVSKTFV